MYMTVVGGVTPCLLSFSFMTQAGIKRILELHVHVLYNTINIS